MATPKPKVPPPRRVPIEVVEQRERFVEDLLANQQRHGQIRQAFRAQFKVTRRTADRYIRRVLDRWETESNSSDRRSRRAQIEESAKLAFRVAHKRNDSRAMTSALELLGKLHGLFQPDNEGGGDVTIVFEGPAAPVPSAVQPTAMGDPPGPGTLPGSGGGT